MVDYWR